MSLNILRLNGNNNKKSESEKLVSITTEFTLVEKRRSFWNAGPLIFSTFYFFPLIFNWAQLSAVIIALQVIVYLSFVLLYWQSITKTGNALVMNLVLMAGLCVAGSWVTTGTSSLFGFIAFFCGFNFLPRYKIIAMLIIIALVLLTAKFIATQQAVYFLMPALCVACGLFIFGWMSHRERVHKELQRQSEEEIKRLGAVAERERIARDLHDLLGHSLSSIALKAELASKFAAANALEQAQSEAQQVADLAREALSEVRQAVTGYHQLALDAQLHILASRLKDKGIAVTLELQAVTLDKVSEACLCFFAKEVCTNIIRHSDADKVCFTLRQDKNNVFVEIKDNGSIKFIKEGNGLMGIRTRLKECGGQLFYNTEQGGYFKAVLGEAG
ncbi:two-component sensor histidine kinase [Pseudoalteromonas piscicida]|uniref:Sensor histidine kinase n=1 Tax=Pseudoalteromonas piscicida TaxID=43662 RepID=A0AAD0RET2_PSEO7|nr:two-component sensor histidine kinase [Pseudoalteromonas piscicida]AXR01082.1 sensor histidine kinase [Pseudoalteromonas piscicida]